MQVDVARSLNARCHCVRVDQDAALGALPEGPHTQGSLFAGEPVFVSEREMAQMEALALTIERLGRTPALVGHALARAPRIAQADPGIPGLLFGYDFHLGEAGPQLIEVNTNAGGMLLLTQALRQIHGECASLDPWLTSSRSRAERLDERVVAMFREEWRRFDPTRALQRVVIVDEAPESQFLYAELLQFQALLQSEGVEVEIVGPEALQFEGGALRTRRGPVDLVYNRLTDFYLEAEHLAPLRRAYEARAVALTPHPHAHALFAHKANLALWSDEAALRHLGVEAQDVARLTAHVPRTSLIGAEVDAEALWSSRRDLYFKPARGFGSRATYAGAKLTRKTFAHILDNPGSYVAQQMIAPTTRALATGDQALKVDVRLFTYQGAVLMVGARLYRGQTTNMRTPMGGLAPVVVV